MKHIQWLTEQLTRERIQHQNALADVHNHFSGRLTEGQQQNFLLRKQIEGLYADIEILKEENKK